MNAWLTAGLPIVAMAWLAWPGTAAALDTVDELDLQRYQGRWHEVARLPNRFQDDCAGNVTADYTLRDDGRVDVVNRCLLGDGDWSVAEGVARRPDPDRPGELEVRFAPGWLSWLPWVWGDYHVIALDDDYGWAVVGAPSREYLWILSRSPRIEESLLERLIERAADQGFPTGDIVRSGPGETDMRP